MGVSGHQAREVLPTSMVTPARDLCLGGSHVLSQLMLMVKVPLSPLLGMVTLRTGGTLGVCVPMDMSVPPQFVPLLTGCSGGAPRPSRGP